jgi:tetratricopeptide (TPR) repeat protein
MVIPIATDDDQPETVGAEPRAKLQRAMALHSAGEIRAAVAAAEHAVEMAPRFAEAHAYLGNTLVTRQRRFADGLAALRVATGLAPSDATILYTTGWCHEYVAHALERPRGAHQAVAEDAPTLYATARGYFFRALQAGPDDQLRGDIEDMLDVVAAATGEPWEDDSPDLAPEH